VQLMLLTGFRAGEWARALWSRADFKQKLLVIPASAYKTDHIHVIPLVPEAMVILKSVLKGRNGEYIYRVCREPSLSGASASSIGRDCRVRSSRTLCRSSHRLPPRAICGAPLRRDWANRWVWDRAIDQEGARTFRWQRDRDL
jgi:integrase